MSMEDKIKHQAEESKGRLKENVGDVTDNPEMQAEGRTETLSAEAKQAGDKAKDAAHEAKDAARDAVDDEDQNR